MNGVQGKHVVFFHKCWHVLIARQKRETDNIQQMSDRY
jgi:hypothetical protein